MVFPPLVSINVCVMEYRMFGMIRTCTHSEICLSYSRNLELHKILHISTHSYILTWMQVAPDTDAIMLGVCRRLDRTTSAWE